MPRDILCCCQYASASYTRQRGTLGRSRVFSTSCKASTTTASAQLTVVPIAVVATFKGPFCNGRRRYALTKNVTVRLGTIKNVVMITVPVHSSHKRPPLQPPLRQELGPGLELKSQLRLPLSSYYSGFGSHSQQSKLTQIR